VPLPQEIPLLSLFASCLFCERPSLTLEIFRSAFFFSFDRVFTGATKRCALIGAKFPRMSKILPSEFLPSRFLPVSARLSEFHAKRFSLPPIWNSSSVTLSAPAI